MTKKTKKYFLSILSGAFIFFHSTVVFAQSYTLPANTGLPTSSGGIKGVLNNALIWMLSIFGIIAIISFVVSGLQYLLSAGDEKAMQTAKRNVTYSILGVVVALASFVIIKAIDAALNASSSSF